MKRLIRLALAALVMVSATATVVTVDAAPAASGWPRIFRQGATSPHNSDSSKQALAQCPAGTQLLGGGGLISQGQGHVQFTRLQPLKTSNQFAAAAAEHGSWNYDWHVWAFAVCSAVITDVTFVAGHTGSDSSESKLATATCPSGKKLLSTGARIIGGNGQVVLDDILPFSDLGKQRSAAYEDGDGYSGSWSLWAYGVCADPPAGLERIVATAQPAEGAEHVYAVASCPAGKFAVGAGGIINGGLGTLFFNGFSIGGYEPDQVTMEVQDLEPGEPPSSWYARAYAICVS